MTAFQNAKEIERIQAAILNTWICPPNDVVNTSDPRGETPATPEVRRKAVNAVFGIVVTDPEVTQLESIGTGFAVKTPSGSMMLSAAHVTAPLKENASRVLLLLEGDEWAKRNDDGKTVKIDVERLRSDRGKLSKWHYSEDESYPYTAGKGIDFARVNGQVPSGVEPLQIRDLEADPLKLNEPLYLVGHQFGKTRFFECANRGMSRERFAGKAQNINFFARCSAVSVNPDGGVPLGGISGGAIVDSKGQAVGVFNGYARSGLRIYIRAVPIYFNKDRASREALLPHPTVKPGDAESIRCFRCFDHFKAASDSTFIESSDKYSNLCVMGNPGSEGRMMMLEPGQ